MPLGLLSLAACLQKTGSYVNIFQPKERLIQPEDYKKAAKHILTYKPDIIGFSTWCITYAASLLIAEQLKILSPNTPLIFGGPQASILAKETMMEFPAVDFVLSGECDLTFPKFIKEFEKKNPTFSKISGLTFRTNSDKIKQTPTNGALPVLDELPVPSYEFVSNADTLKLDVGRGCPFNCTYCSTNNFFSKKYRIKSPTRILYEMNLAFKKSKIRTFSFTHDMFTLNKKFVFDLCEKLILQKKENKTEFVWTCSARIDCVTDKMLIQMKKAGCESIFFGIESGSEKIQKEIKKNLNISRAYTIADICREVGLNMHASFIIGFPNENYEDIEQTLVCALKLSLKGALVQVSELSLLPGTTLHNQYGHKLKLDGNFSNFSNTVCGPKELKLIIDYPSIFSSFYYLPTDYIDRKMILSLCEFINYAYFFRDTIFLLKKQIQDEISQFKIFNLFENEFNNSMKGKETLMISHWIRILKNFLKENKTLLNQFEVYDVFAYEAYTALLKTYFIRWNIISQKKKSKKITQNSIISPTPVWNVLTTSYKLDKILPSLNNWKIKNIKKQKGQYNYLIIAISENYCFKKQIFKKDEYMLKKLSKTPFPDFVNKVKNVSSAGETLKWLKKMQKWGVLEIEINI